MQDKVCVVVLNWNGWPDTAVCLASLRHLRYDNVSVTVVDNGSTNDSVLRLRCDFPWITLIDTGKNLGFAGACNSGIRRGLAEGAEFVWLLNNDTSVHADALQTMVDKAKSDPQIAAVGSAIYAMDEPYRLQAWGGGYINFWLGRSRHFRKPVRDEQVEFITGASMLISRRAVEDVGGLDEQFFMYWEDADYSFRLRQHGWKLAVAGRSRVWHKESASVGANSVRMDAYFSSSALCFFQKHAAAPFVPVWVGGLLRLTKRLAAGDWERSRAVWAGMRRNRTSMKWEAEPRSIVR